MVHTKKYEAEHKVPPGPFEVGHSPRKAGVYEAVYKSEKNKQIKIYNSSYGPEVRSLKL